jgi:1-acyl-sn-glycerol-3-phosphate acyltransferase
MSRDPSFSRPPSRAALVLYRIVRTIAVGVSRLYFPGRIVGRENLPDSGPFILAPIHRSYVDWLIVARVSRRRMRYIVKDEVWKSKAVGRLIEVLGAFPVNRSGADREALERCRAVLEGGEALVMFPEGTRRSGPEVAELRDGVAYLSLRTGAPIVPVGIGGSEHAMPRGSSIPRPRRVDLVIGPPISAPLPRPGSDGANAGSKRTRVPRSATIEQSARLRAAIQEVFDAAEASVDGRRLGSGVGG